MPAVALKRLEGDSLINNIEALNEVSCDLKIFCLDGIVRTQQALLSWSSSFLRRLFMSQLILEDGGKRKEEVSLFLTDFSKNILKSLLGFLHTGELKQTATKEFIETFEQLWEDLKIDKVSFKEVFDAGKILSKQPRAKPKVAKITAIQAAASNSKTPSKAKVPPGPQPLSTVKASNTSAAASPILATNTKRNARTNFLQQSLVLNNPKFSSTPIRPETKTKTFTSKLATVPEKLTNNPQISVSEPKDNVIEVDDDAPVIVEEVRTKNAIPANIKHELPAGISITKQVVTKSSDSADNGKEKETGEAKSSAEQDKAPSEKKAEAPKARITPTVATKANTSSARIAKSKLKRAKSLGRRQPLTSLNQSSSVPGPGRRLSRRTTSSVPTYNLDLMEKNTFNLSRNKRRGGVSATTNKENNSPDLSSSFQEKIVKGTKKLKIPLAKLKDDKLATIQQKKEVAEAARSRIGSPKTTIRATITKTPLKIVTATSKTPMKGAIITKTPAKSSSPAVSIPLSTMKKLDPESAPFPCYICKKTKDDKNRMLCLKNVKVLRSHVSICLYETGKLFKAIPPGPDNTDDQGKPVEEYGGRAGKRYCCEVEGCWLASRRGRNGQIGYKEYAIHMASHHGALEMVLMEDGPEAEKLMEKLMEHEGKKNNSIIKTEDIPAATLTENVVIVKEENSKQRETAGSKLTRKQMQNSLASQVKCIVCQEVLFLKDHQKLRDHFSKCLYEEKKYFPIPLASGEKEETLDDGKESYKCDILGCWMQRKCASGSLISYKTLAVHMASQHGYLEKLLEKDPRPDLKSLMETLKKQGTSSVDPFIECRFAKCKSMNLQFKADNKREIKLHYASQHFHDYFSFNPDTGVPDNFTKTGNRTLCDTCSKNAPKPVYIQSEKEAIRGHLVVKHDIMNEILLKAHDKDVAEAKLALKDIYPSLYSDKFGSN